MNCFYVPGNRHIIDTINPTTGRSAICSESFEQIKKRYPQAEVWDFEKAFQQITALIYASTITAPVEITIDRWDEMMNIMPPMRWRNGGSSESFMICEATTLDLHCIFCRIGDRYFELTDRNSLSHEEIADKCRAIL